MADCVFCHTKLLSIVGDILGIALPERAKAEGSSPSFGDLPEVRDEEGRPRIAQVVKLDNEGASLQVFSGAKGLTTRAKVHFLV
jgi:V/A-type H+-transporting ATPase subunit B